MGACTLALGKKISPLSFNLGRLTREWPDDPWWPWPMPWVELRMLTVNKLRVSLDLLSQCILLISFILARHALIRETPFNRRWIITKSFDEHWTQVERVGRVICVASVEIVGDVIPRQQFQAARVTWVAYLPTSGTQWLGTLHVALPPSAARLDFFVIGQAFSRSIGTARRMLWTHARRTSEIYSQINDPANHRPQQPSETRHDHCLERLLNASLASRRLTGGCGSSNCQQNVIDHVVLDFIYSLQTHTHTHTYIYTCFYVWLTDLEQYKKSAVLSSRPTILALIWNP